VRPLILRRDALALLKPILSAAAVLGAGKALHFLMHVLIGRSLGPAGYGAINLALSAVAILSVVVSLGFQTSLLRFVAGFNASQAWPSLKGILVFSFAVVVVGAATVTGGILGVWAIVRTGHELSPWPLFTGMFLAPTALALWRRSAMIGLQRVAGSLLPRDVLLPALLILGLALFRPGDALAVAVLCTVAMVASEAVGFWWFARAYPIPARRIPSSFDVGHWLRVSVTMLLSGLSRLGLDRWDVLFIGSLLGMTPVGIYGAAARISLLGALALMIVNAVMAPKISAAYHTEGPSAGRRVMLQAMAISLVISLPVFVVILFWPEELIRLFGAGFEEAAPLLRILACGQLVHAVTGPAGLALSMTIYEKSYAAILLTSTVANALLLLAVIPGYGLTGAAWVTAGTMAATGLVGSGTALVKLDPKRA